MARGIPVSEFNPIHEIQFEEVLGRSDGLPNPAGEFHVQTQSQDVQQSLQQGISDLHLDTYETGETSSARNVRMRRNIEESLMESVYPTSPVTANPSPPPQVTGNSSASEIFRNSAYDPSFEMRGLPLDPHLRLFFFNNNPEQAAACNRNTLYDPSFEERGLPLDPHLRCFALELAKKNGGNDDKLDLN
ncbi:uncharacterized protein LOC108328684 isoform X3 [Vigna angularis]|uniref:uncharacterized protein LOC108328684 isoform X3 n=1 Tax=Phaseolus angularis TaxID=3914 RepID=UPI0022B56F52|nr:uncharacterized protein LOC108328684 isoform X3 [Vigna angularis]